MFEQNAYLDHTSTNEQNMCAPTCAFAFSTISQCIVVGIIRPIDRGGSGGSGGTLPNNSQRLYVYAFRHPSMHLIYALSYDL